MANNETKEGAKFHEKAMTSIVSLHFQANSKLLADFMGAVENFIIN